MTLAPPTSTPRPTFDLMTPTPIPSPTPSPLPPTATPTPKTTPTPVRPTPRPTTSAKGVTATITPTIAITPTATVTATAAPTQTPNTQNLTPHTLGGDLISARDRDPSNLHPYGPADKVGQEYRELVWDAKLLQRNPSTLDWENHAASAFKYDNASKTVTLTLKNGLKWSDDEPLTSDDYVWTYQQASDIGRNWAGLGFYAGKIESYTAPDPLTIVVKLRDTFSNPLELANMIEPLPKHIWQDKSWSEPDKNPEIIRPSVVSGPWKLREWKANDKIVFVRNEASPITPPPYLASLTFIRVGDSKKALDMLAKGEIDFYSPPPEQVGAMQQIGRVVTYRWQPATPSWYYLGFNFNRPLWQNADMRRTLANLTDRDRLIKDAAYGLASPTYSDVPPGSPSFTDLVYKAAYNVEQANTALERAGYRWDGRDIVDRQGQPLPELRLLYPNDNPVYERIASYYQQQLSAIGFKIKVLPTDPQALLAQVQDAKGDYDLFVLSWKPVSPSLELFGTVWKNPPGGYTNSELTALYAQAALTSDDKARQNLLNSVQQLQARELPQIYLFANQGYLGVRFDVGGVETGPLGPTARRYTDWYIR